MGEIYDHIKKKVAKPHLIIKNKKSILIAPLDWGLGHATRCIPIIQYLQKNGHDLTIAGNHATQTMLKKEFPTAEFIFIKGYNIKYPTNVGSFNRKILQQIPKIWWAIVREHFWLRDQLKKRSWDLLISDNRYGLHTKKIPSVFITHQLRVQTGSGKLADDLIQSILYRKINKFTHCWIPDEASNIINIAGLLSHPIKKPNRYKYIGLLSRLNNISSNEGSSILIVLSGPEPQRTILENILLQQLSDTQEKIIFVRGLPLASKEMTPQKNIQFKNYMDSVELEKAMEEAEIVVCRAGYSSIMDLLKLNKRAIIIPTPGQTEQEYLATHLNQLKLFVVQSQKSISLIDAFDLSRNSCPENNSFNFEGYKKALEDLGI